VIDFDINIAEATAAPRIHHQWQPDNVSTERGISPDTLRILEARGFILPKEADGAVTTSVLGRTNSVMRQNGYFAGSADPRAADGAIAGF
jgi:gamma-glutamyltranspeptidase/glutathione hydrolase